LKLQAGGLELKA